MKGLSDQLSPFQTNSFGIAPVLQQHLLEKVS